MYTNADQLVNKRYDLEMMIADNKPDVMLITEVIPKGQVNPITSALLKVEGYDCILNFDPEKPDLGASGIRGVAIYYKESLSVTEVELQIDDCKDHAWIEIASEKGDSLLCGCVYRTQSNDVDKEGCMKSAKLIASLIQEAYKRNKNLLIAGDFNYKEIDWDNESAPSGKDHLDHFIKILQECYLYQHVTEPTRFREGENANLLDLILTSEEGAIQNLSYHPPLGESDHLCLRFDVPLTKQKPKKNNCPKYNIFKTNFAEISAGIKSRKWEEVLTKSFAEDYETFFDFLASEMRANTPFATDPVVKKSIYMNNEALRLKNAKTRLWKKYLATRSSFDRRKYVESKNKLRSLTRNLRRDFERKITEEIKKKPKVFWKYAKSRLKTRASIPPLTKTDGSQAKTARDRAETLNAFFASVFTKEDTTKFPAAPQYNMEDFLENIDITPEIVFTKLTNLNQNKSAGHDEWHPFFLKNLAEALSVPLSILFNKSLKEGAHKSWRIAIISAIYKKGKRNEPGNYRPVSLTSVISKIMESIVRDAIVDHLVKINVLSDGQHGFVPERDCITQLLLCLEDWTSMIEDGSVFDVIYTDFAKAFDSVAHERLLIKLEAIGIRGDLLNWIRSFLTGRTQCVRVEGETSGWQKVLSGIPQGSVLGPLLFVIFINDMPSVVKESICKLFADDCKLYRVIENEEDRNLQADVENLERWSKEWQLPFNETKCKVMHFGRGNPQHSYTMNGHMLESTTQEKDLGVIIDDTLKFHVHTAAAAKKANQVLGIIKKSYSARDADTISTLYKAMVRPLLEYGNVIWGPHYRMDMKTIERVQRRATKLVDELRDKPYKERLKALKLPSLIYRRRRGDMITMFKLQKGLVRVDLEELFKPLEFSKTRGHQYRVHKGKAIKQQRIFSFSQRVINSWNSLPNHVVTAPTMDTFKNRLDTHWEQHHYETMED